MSFILRLAIVFAVVGGILSACVGRRTVLVPQTQRMDVYHHREEVRAPSSPPFTEFPPAAPQQPTGAPVKEPEPECPTCPT
jgi:hypothetical protein